MGLTEFSEFFSILVFVLIFFFLLLLIFLSSAKMDLSKMPHDKKLYLCKCYFYGMFFRVGQVNHEQKLCVLHKKIVIRCFIINYVFIVYYLLLNQQVDLHYYLFFGSSMQFGLPNKLF